MYFAGRESNLAEGKSGLSGCRGAGQRLAPRGVL